MYYGSVNYNDKTIQRPVYGTNDYMKGVDRSRWFQGSLIPELRRRRYSKTN